MGGVFSVVSKTNCVQDLFYGTDYHSHLGTKRGGLAVLDEQGGFKRIIHNIENAQFRSKFDDDLDKLKGCMGIGCISDTEDQPLLISSHLGRFAIVTVGRINNQKALIKEAFGKRNIHFSEMTGSETNPTELVASLISREEDYVSGIRAVQESVDGSCSLLILTDEGVYAGRDRWGRTPLIIGEKEGTYSVTMETCAFPNLGYQHWYELGPGEVVLITPDGIEQKAPPYDAMRICAFLWVYYGYPASSYEGINVEAMRYKNGQLLAQNDDIAVDMVAGIPDSGTAHAIGYANASQAPYGRPFAKYTPTWPRSFMPQNQSIRDLVAKMKLIPVPELIKDRRIVFCEDSIVRGTQLRETMKRLYSYGAKEIHMRPACPPLVFGCKFLNFSRSKSELDLAGRRAIREIEKTNNVSVESYVQPESDRYNEMVERIRRHLLLTTLKYQTIPSLLESIGLPKDKICTYCWDGQG